MQNRSKPACIGLTFLVRNKTNKNKKEVQQLLSLVSEHFLQVASAANSLATLQLAHCLSQAPAAQPGAQWHTAAFLKDPVDTKLLSKHLKFMAFASAW